MRRPSIVAFITFASVPFSPNIKFELIVIAPTSVSFMNAPSTYSFIFPELTHVAAR